MGDFRKELRGLINGHNKESGSNTPDSVLAEYLEGCLDLFDATVNRRSEWYGRQDVPGKTWVEVEPKEGEARISERPQYK